MNEVKLALELAQYSNDVTIKTHEIAGNYKNWLVQNKNVPYDASILAQRLFPKLSEDEMIEFTKVLDSVISMYDDSMANFKLFLEFNTWNIEKTETALKNHQDLVKKYS